MITCRWHLMLSPLISSEHCIFSLWGTMYIFLLVLRRTVANMASLFNHLWIILNPFLYVAFNAMKCLPSYYIYYFYRSWFTTSYFLRTWYMFLIGDNKSIFILMTFSMSMRVGGGGETPKITTLNCSDKLKNARICKVYHPSRWKCVMHRVNPFQCKVTWVDIVLFPPHVQRNLCM